jgi:hypothetical protein
LEVRTVDVPAIVPGKGGDAVTDDEDDQIETGDDTGWTWSWHRHFDWYCDKVVPRG